MNNESEAMLHKMRQRATAEDPQHHRPLEHLLGKFTVNGNRHAGYNP
jgi:hypothetical protein